MGIYHKFIPLKNVLMAYTYSPRLIEKIALSDLGPISHSKTTAKSISHRVITSPKATFFYVLYVVNILLLHQYWKITLLTESSSLMICTCIYQAFRQNYNYIIIHMPTKINAHSHKLNRMEHEVIEFLYVWPRIFFAIVVARVKYYFCHGITMVHK